jgi:hypothetical protein
MRTPDFVIVGAMKAATFTLSRNLSAHPQIFLPHGEVHFFNDDAAYARGVASYAAHFADAASGQIIGEKSVSYYFTPSVPARIHALNPNMKLIWLLRDPVTRAVSHYWFSVWRGMEVESMRDAMRREQRRDGTRQLGGYLTFGQYSDFIAAYDAYFPRAQMLFLRFEDFVANPTAGLEQSARFVGADMTTFRYPDVIRRENTTRMPRSQALQTWARRRLKARAFRLWQAVRTINTALGPAHYPAPDADITALLSAHFAPYNQRLSELIGWDVSAWG